MGRTSHNDSLTLFYYIPGLVRLRLEDGVQYGEPTAALLHYRFSHSDKGGLLFASGETAL